MAKGLRLSEIWVLGTVTALLKKQLRSDEGPLDFLIMRPTVFIKHILADFEGTLDF